MNFAIPRKALTMRWPVLRFAALLTEEATLTRDLPVWSTSRRFVEGALPSWKDVKTIPLPEPLRKFTYRSWYPRRMMFWLLVSWYIDVKKFTSHIRSRHLASKLKLIYFNLIGTFTPGGGFTYPWQNASFVFNFAFSSVAVFLTIFFVRTFSRASFSFASLKIFPFCDLVFRLTECSLPSMFHRDPRQCSSSPVRISRCKAFAKYDCCLLRDAVDAPQATDWPVKSQIQGCWGLPDSSFLHQDVQEQAWLRLQHNEIETYSSRDTVDVL